LSGYHLLYAVRGDLLARLGRGQEAAAAFTRAAALTANTEQRLLRDRADACVHAGRFLDRAQAARGEQDPRFGHVLEQHAHLLGKLRDRSGGDGIVRVRSNRNR
jgi:hypothetical protein